LFSLRTLLASIIMAFFVYTALYYMADQVNMERTIGIFWQVVVALFAGLASYFIASYKLNRNELIQIVSVLVRKPKK